MAGSGQWVSIDDPEEDRTWVFDVDFLTSRWTCIYGRGCQGVLTEPAPQLAHGCCSYGAHMVDDDDARRVEAIAATLGPQEWQFRQRARRTGVLRQNGATRVVGGACIFLNRQGFPTGPGCALHQAAIARGRHPSDFKPEVCWQLPLRREDRVEVDGHVTSTVGPWERRHWGAGGLDFAWWCTEAPEAFVGRAPVYEQMAYELEKMVGGAVLGALSAEISRRAGRARSRRPTS